MKHYHSISNNVKDYLYHSVFAFEKLDGSNFCAEWNKKLSKKSQFTNGFGKFGTRTQMIKNKNNPFCEAINIFMDKYSEGFDRIFNDNKLFRGIDTITVYGEFYGPRSFAGQHDWINDIDDFDVVVFDMFLYKKDFVKPKDFIEIFGELGIPRLVYQGLLDEAEIDKIVTNEYGLKEGVVIKGVNEGKVFMVKCKTQLWLDKVKALYGSEDKIPQS